MCRASVFRGNGAGSAAHYFVGAASKREREEQERLDAERRQREEKERLETEQRETERRLEAERRQREEQDQLEAAQQEKERLESERLDKERLEAKKGYEGGAGWDACTGLGTPAGNVILCPEAEAKERLEAERREVPAPVSDASQAIDRVKFSVFAPGVIRPAQQFLLDLWVHLPTQTDEVTSLAREFARERRLGVKPQVAVTHGAALSVVLDLPSLRIKDPSNTIFWNGEPDYASFVVEVPADVAVGGHPGQVIITASGIPISKVTSKLQIPSLSAYRQERN